MIINLKEYRKQKEAERIVDKLEESDRDLWYALKGDTDKLAEFFRPK